MPDATASSMSRPARVSPSGVRTNQTVEPSADTAMERGTPSVNRAVRAERRGKDSVTGLIQPELALGTGYAAIMTHRRLLLVHAHPDDESIFTGATMARYAAEGAQVTLVTCTAGEEGEILIPEIGHLAADRDDALGPHRVAELKAAMACLGVSDHRFLGGEFGFRDSGMQWGPDRQAMPREETAEDTFWRADLAAASAVLVEIIREIRPHVLVTYDEFGGYGHPDHIQAHRVATYGASLAAVDSYRRDLGEAWDIPKIYWIASGPLRALERSEVTAVIDGREFADSKIAALRAHSSQIDGDGPFITGVRLTESFRLAKGVASPPAGASVEDDLFAGL